MQSALNSWTLRFAAASLFASIAVGSARAEGVPAAKVTGPIPVRSALGDPSHDYPFLTPKEDLAKLGFVEEEFFVEGTANRYDTAGGREAKVTSSGHAYRTRVVVRRPKEAAKFNGTVLVEWQNVTAGYDIDAHWGPSWEHFVEHGYAWVGVSAQRVGVHGNATTAPATGATPPGIPTSTRNNGLKAWSPTRYGTLDVTDGGKVTDDALCYDIFSQATQALKRPGAVDLLGGLKPKHVFAIGASQSAGRLSIYYNSIQPLHQVVDAYYLLVGGSGLRTDSKVKVFQLLSETDVAGGPQRRQADSDVFRGWEVAGSAHSSYYADRYRAPLIDRDFGEPVWPAECDQPPFARVKTYHVINAQYDLLVKWEESGVAPPAAPKIAFTSATPPVIDRDASGIAKGGIRLPDVSAPIALNSGVNTGGSFCRLYGTYQPYDATKLRALYPDHASYVNAVTASAKENLAAGYVLDAGAAALISEAESADIPPR
ncbi:MAG: alpha/beta hydrolase domain-containing protein [Polyangiales bacterium]